MCSYGIYGLRTYIECTVYLLRPQYNNVYYQSEKFLKINNLWKTLHKQNRFKQDSYLIISPLRLLKTGPCESAVYMHFGGWTLRRASLSK